jgi:hypothetical protein
MSSLKLFDMLIKLKMKNTLQKFREANINLHIL